MKCTKCKYYVCGPDFNCCNLFGFDNFKIVEDCIYVNDDGTLNHEEIKKSPI